ncbi:hypothetical protein ACFW0V_30990 [Micromonospora parva]|uniref:hypothetical protein n=1 Tax=Micromonospora parva TaxID=1464048 RepID=UPI00366E4720
MAAQLYTAEQVLAIAADAYARGRYDRDLNELHGTWTQMAEPVATREERVDARLAEMEQHARAQAQREGRPYRIHPGGPVDWETGAPTTTEVDR